jgi:hypothetical protein
MQICEFDSFAEFENFVSKNDLETNKTWKPFVVEGPLYRGHADPCWKIESTLDRAINNCSVSDYYNSIYKAYFEISGVAGRTWPLKDIMSIRNQCANFENFPGIPSELPNPEHLTYLRHYGFPSPLVDWSRPPYVAAFFAYRFPATPEKENVSIFVIDNINKDLAKPIVQSNLTDHVIQVGRSIATDRRHFIQQSDYTSCFRYKNQKWEFCSHEDFLLSTSSGEYSSSEVHSSLQGTRPCAT